MGFLVSSSSSVVNKTKSGILESVTQGNFLASSSCVCVCVYLMTQSYGEKKNPWIFSCLMETVNEKYILFSKMILIDLPCLPRALC